MADTFMKERLLYVFFMADDFRFPRFHVYETFEVFVNVIVDYCFAAVLMAAFILE
ncbi:MAG: hypothetical protein EPGJADBJ_02390 [Saprospiraceae bacterium]|nr:hypothetical protein [Saprospiraceae bacterium]